MLFTFPWSLWSAGASGGVAQRRLEGQAEVGRGWRNEAGLIGSAVCVTSVLSAASRLLIKVSLTKQQGGAELRQS